MSRFDPFHQLLARYYALEFHQNPVLAGRLEGIQRWQKLRMQYTHAELFAIPAHQPLTQYFMSRLYVGPEFDALAGQCEHFLKTTAKFERLIPEHTLSTAQQAVTLTLLLIELDQQLAALMDFDFAIDMQDFRDYEPELVKLYRESDQAEARCALLTSLDELGLRLDRYVHSGVIKTLFKLSKGLTLHVGLGMGYSFLDHGFMAMAPLKSAETFIRQFSHGERALLERIYSGTPQPFSQFPPYNVT